MGWTDDRVELLKKLWAEGLSASQIAKQLGGGLSRNAVIGKVHRMGLAGRASASIPRAPREPRQPRPVREPLPRKVFLPPPPPPTPIPLGEPGRATVLTLEAHMCKWPIGDPAHPGFTMCGRRTEDGSYCPAHAELAYQPSKKGSTANDLARSLRRYL